MMHWWCVNALKKVVTVNFWSVDKITSMLKLISFHETSVQTSSAFILPSAPFLHFPCTYEVPTDFLIIWRYLWKLPSSQAFLRVIHIGWLSFQASWQFGGTSGEKNYFPPRCTITPLVHNFSSRSISLVLASQPILDTLTTHLALNLGSDSCLAQYITWILTLP